MSYPGDEGTGAGRGPDEAEVPGRMGPGRECVWQFRGVAQRCVV